VLAASAIPTRLVGAVTKSKAGSVSITYAEPGQVKKTTKSFLPNEIVAALAGEAGYVIAMLNTPITKIVGEQVIKDGVRFIKTDGGNVQLNQLPGVTFDVKEVEADSKEARAAERAGRVKVRGARRPVEEVKKSSKADRRAAAKASASSSSKSSKSEKAEKPSAKDAAKKKRR